MPHGSAAVPAPPPGWPAARPARPLVKVCGLTTPTLARAAADAGADMVGLVHFAASPRHLDRPAAADVADAVRGRAFLVALTVDADDETLDGLVAAARPDALQLHGHESPARAAALAARYGLPVAKALGIAHARDLATAGAHRSLLVLDAKPPPGAERPGGHGQRFDWSLVTPLARRRAFMLSGGLDPQSAAEAVRRVRPYALDVSTGVESGKTKDPRKITAFLAAVRAAARHA